jgi:hypothetical protein
VGWLLLDLVKIRVVAGRDRNMAHSFIEALQQVIKNPLQFIGYYLLMFLLWIFVLIGYWYLQHQLSDRSLGGILLEFFLVQAAIWIQLWVRFSRYKVLLQLVKRLKNKEVTGLYIAES